MSEETDGVKKDKALEWTRERQKDWPAWAEWFAVDGNGAEWVYAQKPVRSDENNYWRPKGVGDPMVCVHATGGDNYGLRKDWGGTLLRIVDVPAKKSVFVVRMSANDQLDDMVKGVQGSVDLETAKHKCKVCAGLDECGRVTAWILREGKDCLGFDITPFKSCLGGATEKALPEKEFKPGDKFTTIVGDVVTLGEWNGRYGFMNDKYVAVSVGQNLPPIITQKAIDHAFGVDRYRPVKGGD
jgi:hypothetical protein